MIRHIGFCVAVLSATTACLVAPTVSPAATITEFSAGITPGSGPEGITAGPDGNLWFTEENKPQVGRITPTGGVTEFSAGISAGGLGITTGPDHNLWFTEFGAGKIGRITPSGTVTEFPLPVSSQPAGITAGPDGSVWFTDSGTSKIGRITPAGTITEFPTPSSLADPRGITLGPDGNLWFTERNVDRIARMTPTGASTDFSAGITPKGGMTDITLGPDGNLWFTEPTAQQIGQITAAGVVREFPVSLGSNGVVAGLDGNLWYTTYGLENAIGRLTPAGATTTFSSGLSESAGGIAAGPDGNLWFTEYTPSKIGRLTIDRPLATTGAPSAITTTTATLAGSVDPQGASVPTSYHFEYGFTTAYGQSTPSQTLTGGSPSAVSAALSGLFTSTRYHYRLVASNATGTAVGADQTFTTVPRSINCLCALRLRLVVTNATQSHRRWREGSRLASFSRKRLPVGTTFSFTLNEQARVSFAFTQQVNGRKVKGKCVTQTKKNRHKPACRRTLRSGTLSFAAHSGLNKVFFQGRISRSRKLKPGHYTLVITATNASGRRSRPVRLSFTIVK